ncbi:hypothetical protein [Fusibacter bizertensis]
MNGEKLKQLEATFLDRYPQGFNDPRMLEVAKKHKVEAMHQFVEAAFSKDRFENPAEIADAFTKLISKSSLVSVFEKSRYRDIAKQFSRDEKEVLSESIYAFLYGDQRKGFNQLVELLAHFNIAKWPILTVLGLYHNGDFEVLVKPSTVKSILKYLEVTDVIYTTKPNYDFYQAYRTFINELKQMTSEKLASDNGAFCGFLMITIE